MSEKKKVQLRRIDNHKARLPEAELLSEGPYAFHVLWDGEVQSQSHFFSKTIWEAIPPPLTLPGGIGAIVRGRSTYARVGKNAWTTVDDNEQGDGRMRQIWSDGTMLREHKIQALTILHEGVEL